jgi:hypothetical protein
MSWNESPFNNANRQAWFKPGGNAGDLVSVVDIFSAKNIQTARGVGEREKLARVYFLKVR